MPKSVSYSYARQHLASILNAAEDRQEPIIITRRNREDIAVIPSSELEGLKETAHLLRSPKNARRLLQALQRALEDTVSPQTVSELKEEVGVE
jgi:antitoxin YefM